MVGFSRLSKRPGHEPQGLPRTTLPTRRRGQAMARRSDSRISATPKGSRNHPGALLVVAAERVARRAGRRAALGKSLRDVEKRLSDVEKVNTRLEEAAVSTPDTGARPVHGMIAELTIAATPAAPDPSRTPRDCKPGGSRPGSRPCRPCGRGRKPPPPRSAPGSGRKS